MGKKKKKEKKKLTKEEKAELKALKKARLEDKKRRVRLDHLALEQRMADASWRELKRYFRHMITKMQMPTVRTAMETMWHSYDFTFDHKTHAIEKLLHDLDETEGLRQKCVATHASNFDALIALMSERSQQEYDTYKENRARLLAAALRVRDRMSNSQMTTRVNFNIVGGAMAARAMEQETTTQGDYLTRLDDERDKLNDARKLLKGVLERQLDYSWRGLRSTLTQYETSAVQRRKRLADVAARDSRAAALLQRQEAHVQHLETTEQSMRYRLANEHPARSLRAPLAEVRYFTAAYCALKQRLTHDLGLDERQMTELVSRSGLALENLRRLMEKAERILRLGSMCARMETFVERHAPLNALDNPCTFMPPPPLHRQLESDYEDPVALPSVSDLPLLSAFSFYANRASEMSGENEEGSVTSESSTGSTMSLFWRRVARADTRRSDLLLRREALLMERATLVRAMRCCLRVDEDECPPARAEICAPPCADVCAPKERQVPTCPGARGPTQEASHFYKKTLQW